MDTMELPADSRTSARRTMYPYNIVQPEVMIFMIVELVSSTCYSSILYNEPVDIGELKPYLYICINNIIDTHAGTVKA